jgi:uncharacterized membrane protein (DUF106 family)
MSLITPIVDIALISAIMALVSQILQRKFGNVKRTKEIQKEMKEKQKRLNELLKKGDEKSKREADILQKEILEGMNESMKGSMKYMLFSMPIFLIVFALLSFFYSGVSIGLPFPVPVIHRNWAFEITATISWLWFYIYCSLISSIALSQILNVIEKKREQKKAQSGNEKKEENKK